MWTNELPTKPGVYLWRARQDIPEEIINVCWIAGKLWSRGARPVADMKGQWCNIAYAIDRIAALEKRLEAVEVKTTEQAIRDTVWNEPVTTLTAAITTFGPTDPMPNLSAVSVAPVVESIAKPATVEAWMKRHRKEPYTGGTVTSGWSFNLVGETSSSKFDSCNLPKNIADALGMKYCWHQSVDDKSAIAALDVALRKCGELAEPKETVTYDVGDVVKNEGDTLVAVPGPATQSPLAALANKWERGGVLGSDYAAELRAALAAVEPSEEEITAAYCEMAGVCPKSEFIEIVQWVLERIKGK